MRTCSARVSLLFGTFVQGIFLYRKVTHARTEFTRPGNEARHYCERAQRRGMCACATLRNYSCNAYLELRRALKLRVLIGQQSTRPFVRTKSILIGHFSNMVTRIFLACTQVYSLSDAGLL